MTPIAFALIDMGILTFAVGLLCPFTLTHNSQDYEQL